LFSTHKFDHELRNCCALDCESGRGLKLGFLHFELDNGWNAPTVKVMDISGKEVVIQKISNHKTIDISEFSKGLYLITLEENNKKIARKIIF
jgi:hypothetical protein